MASSVDVTAPPHGAPVSERKRKGMSRATKILIGVAALLVVAGLLLKLMAPDTAGQMSTSSSGGANLVDGQGNPIPQSQSSEPDWAPGFMKLGFSFFVCFAIGYAARKFLKVGLVVAGVVFSLLYLASYLGYVNVDWSKMGVDFDGFVERAKNQFDSAKAFITGSLPAAGMGGLGLFAGFKQG